MSGVALAVDELSVRAGDLELVRGVSFELRAGERVALIGESGSGKSLTALAIVGLLGRGLRSSGRVRLGDVDLMAATERRRCQLRGNRIAMIFQDPMTALDPTMRIGRQVAEPLRIHRGLGRKAAAAAAVELLARVEIPDPVGYAQRYPHELSGGLRQRVMMAIAIACDPDVILADEPTTALDVTVQRKVLELLDRLVEQERCALLLITHDLAVVSELCDRVVTMYGGRVVESGDVDRILSAPSHPYTDALLATSAAVAVTGAADGPLPAIPGSVPPAGQFPPGCPFRNRCGRVTGSCTTMPPLTGDGEGRVACWHPVRLAVGGSLEGGMSR